MILEVLNSTGCSHLTNDSTLWAELQSDLMYAIENDFIIWDGNSVNSHWDATHSYAFEYSLQLRHELNKRFNKSWGKVWKLTDITGVPSTVVPLLNDSGIYAIHLGANGVGTLPGDLPDEATLKTIFDSDPARLWRWKHYPSMKETIVMMEIGYGQFILPNS